MCSWTTIRLLRIIAADYVKLRGYQQRPTAWTIMPTALNKQCSMPQEKQHPKGGSRTGHGYPQPRLLCLARETKRKREMMSWNRESLQRQLKRLCGGTMNWIDSRLVRGSWAATRALRKGSAKRPIQVQDKDGHWVESAARADTLADYFEHIQWKVT